MAHGMCLVHGLCYTRAVIRARQSLARDVAQHACVTHEHLAVACPDAAESHQFTDDLHLQTGCVGVGHGTGGTDVGIYGSSSPYKPGAMPFNPHFRQADIAPSTNNNGALPVNIRVAAQSH